MQIIQTEEEHEAFYQKCLLTLKKCFPVIPSPTFKQLGFDSIPACVGEAAAVALYFSGKRWDEIFLTDIWSDYEGPPDAILHFLNNAGFLYYIPAFMLMFLRQKDEEVDIVGDSILSAIRYRSSLLSRKQKRAILPILLYIVSAPEFIPYRYSSDDALLDCIKLCSD